MPKNLNISAEKRRSAIRRAFEDKDKMVSEKSSQLEALQKDVSAKEESFTILQNAILEKANKLEELQKEVNLIEAKLEEADGLQEKFRKEKDELTALQEKVSQKKAEANKKHAQVDITANAAGELRQKIKEQESKLETLKNKAEKHRGSKNVLTKLTKNSKKIGKKAAKAKQETASHRGTLESLENVLEKKTGVTAEIFHEVKKLEENVKLQKIEIEALKKQMDEVALSKVYLNDLRIEMQSQKAELEILQTRINSEEPALKDLQTKMNSEQIKLDVLLHEYGLLSEAKNSSENNVEKNAKKTVENKTIKPSDVALFANKRTRDHMTPKAKRDFIEKHLNEIVKDPVLVQALIKEEKNLDSSQIMALVTGVDPRKASAPQQFNEVADELFIKFVQSGDGEAAFKLCQMASCGHPSAQFLAHCCEGILPDELVGGSANDYFADYLQRAAQKGHKIAKQMHEQAGVKNLPWEKQWNSDDKKRKYSVKILQILDSVQAPGSFTFFSSEKSSDWQLFKCFRDEIKRDPLMTPWKLFTKLDQIAGQLKSEKSPYVEVLGFIASKMVETLAPHKDMKKQREKSITGMAAEFINIGGLHEGEGVKSVPPHSALEKWRTDRIIEQFIEIGGGGDPKEEKPANRSPSRGSKN